MSSDPCYTILASNDLEPSTENELKNRLEKGSDSDKVDAMREIITSILNGDKMERLLMHVIRFVMPSKNKTLKKLLHFYWEVCPKYNPDGKLKQEMILVCNAVRNDLQHPNEFIRGATLRFLCKLRDAELLEPLVPPTRSCLDHRLSYVRKNAILAVSSIYKNQPHLIPDAPDLIQAFLAAETDFTCKRNAFIFLCNTSPEKAVEFLKSVYDQISNFDELLQLAIIDFIRKNSKTNTNDRAKYIRIIFDLLNASSQSVKYEAANSLITLTTNATAIKAAANSYLELINKESDNNIKSIVLDRFNDLRTRFPGYLNELVMDLLRVLSSTDIDVRRKALKIALKLVNNNNVKEMVSSLQKELSKTHSQEFEKNTEYREVLIQSIHQCAVRFPEVAPNVISALMQFLAEGASSAAVDVVAFIKEIAEKFEDLRPVILKNLLVSFNEIKSSKALRGALWIVGEYCQDVETIENAWQKIRDSIGEIPIVASEQRNLERAQEEQQDSDATDVHRSSAPSALRVLQDGTYATETSATSALSSHNNSSSRPPIRSLLLKGDYFIGTVVAATITKLVLRYETLESDSSKSNSLRAEALLIMTSIIRVGQSQFTYIPIEEDSYDRIMDHIKLLTSSNRNSELENVLKVETRQAFTQTVLSNAAAAKRRDAHDIEVGDDAIESASKQVAVDDKIIFRQLAPPTSQGLEDEYERDLTNATGELSSKENFATKLDRIVQLSGFSDAVYCEAIVEVHQYDILLDILLINQTNETLQNLTVEFATLGNLKVVEKPASFNLAPKATHSLRSSIKVSSTETGVIFGNIVYDLGSGSSNCVVLNDIHADIMDYIKPAYCTENQFRSMWTEFEWENKVSVTTPIGSLSEFLGQILKATNMATLTPQKALSGDCGFLSTNLYARTIFGEDALANLSIEKQDDGPITGHVRIRSKAQGLALSLGDRITLAQKEIASNAPQVPETPLITVD